MSIAPDPNSGPPSRTRRHIGTENVNAFPWRFPKMTAPNALYCMGSLCFLFGTLWNAYKP